MEIHLIANAHIDPVWLWRWPEGMQVVRATCQNILELMEKFPHFKFVFSSASFYKWLREVDEELFLKVKRYVEEGRWEIVGGWWVEPDCNIPTGESFVRHSLYGQLYLEENLGRRARVGYNPDSFGHNASLPQILSKSGLPYYVFMRPSPWEKELPSYLFLWRSRDGSSVLTFRIPFSYTGGRDIKEHIKRVIGEMDGKLERTMCFFGRGDHGGGPVEEDLKSIEELKQELEGHKLTFSTTYQFFQTVKKEDLPIVEGELQYHSRGCYTSCTMIKTLNRRTECALINAEKFATFASLLTGREYPREELRKGWENLLFCQFHDILAGTSIPSAYEDARNMLGEALSIGERVTHLSLQSIARNVNTLGEGEAVLIFNPSSWTRREAVEVELAWSGEGMKVVDAFGKEEPAQEIQSQSVTGMRRFLFMAEVPPLGYALYRLLPSEKKEGVPCLENEYLKIEIDENGYISRFWDKKNEMQPLLCPAFVPVVVKDEGDAWAHDIVSFREEVGRFVAKEIKWVEKGPIRWRLRVKSEYERSSLWEEFILYRDLPFLDVECTLDWREKHRMLKIAVPTPWKDSLATFSIPYGFVERPQNGEEQPLGSWMNIDSPRGDYGIALINDCKYGGDVMEGEMRLSIVRSPVYAHHVPHPLDEGVDYLYMDQGIHRFVLRLLPHNGDWREGMVVERAEELNNPLYIMREHNHGGDHPPYFSLLKVEGEGVILSALKRAERSSEVIARLWESRGRKVSGRIELLEPHALWEGWLQPCEIKTLKLTPSLQWEEVNLLEE